MEVHYYDRIILHLMKKAISLNGENCKRHIEKDNWGDDLMPIIIPKIKTSFTDKNIR